MAVALGPLPLARKGHQDISGALASRSIGDDALDCFDRYHHSATVEPVLNVPAARSPLKIARSAVPLVLVHVVDAIKAKRVGHEGIGDKAVHQDGRRSAVSGELDFGVATSVRVRHSEPSADEAVASLAVVDNAIHAQDAAEVADLVQPFVSANVSPLFSRKRFGLFAHLWEKLKHGLFNVEGAPPTIATGRAKLRDFVALVDRDAQHLRGQRFLGAEHAVDTRGSANVSKIRNFVKSFMAGDGPPFLSHVVTSIRNRAPETGRTIRHPSYLGNSQTCQAFTGGN